MKKSFKNVIVTGICVAGMVVCLLGILHHDVTNTINSVIRSAARKDREAGVSQDGNNVVVKLHANKRIDNWGDLFQFLPKSVDKCQNIFDDINTASASIYTDTYTAAMANLESFMISKNLKATEGYSAHYSAENLVYYKMSKLPFVKTVCETGFNAGHSTIMWLESRPDSKVYSFDLGSHKYSRLIAVYLMKQYPGRLNITWGDSTKTLTEFRIKYPNIKCDLLSIDGGHNYKVCNSDYDNFKKMANENNVVILDNYPDQRFKNDLGQVWETGKQNNEILEIFRCSYEPEKKQGFTVGRYVRC